MASDKMLGSFNQKSVPEDNDLLVEYDASASKVKNVKFGGVWNWIVKKLTSAVINELQTSSKNVVGAINELNSKSKFYWAYDAMSKFIQIVFETNNSDHLYFDTYDVVQFRFNNKEIRCSARTYSTQNWSVIWTK